MAFPEKLAAEVQRYCSTHIPSEKWYQENFFTFITDQKIRDRIIIEHKNARFIYKVFEGLQAKDEQLLAQIKTQVIMYVSIQEEVVNYVLFNLYQETEEVKKLLTIKKLKKISIPQKTLSVLKKELCHNDQIIQPCYYSTEEVDRTKVRYDQKVNVLSKLKLISEELEKDLINLYTYRNTIHLEAERKKQLDYDLKMGELAFRRVEGLSIELSEKINSFVEES